MIRNNAKKLAVLAEVLVNESESETSDDSESYNSSSSSSNSSEEDMKPRRVLHRIVGFVERTVLLYDEQEFKEHFRLRRVTCNFLIEIIHRDNVVPTHEYGRKKITAEKALLMTVWYLSNTETFRQIADRFNVTMSSAHRTIKRVVQHLVAHSNQYIKWPENARRTVVHNGFQRKKGLKNVIGAIDGCHININKPMVEAHVYCNRKSEYSILMQAVSDHEKRFIDVFCGEAGSIHDARLLKRSSLYEKGVNGFLGNDVLVGDSAYPCLNWLISPFRDNGHLTHNEKMFNYYHSATRIIIENAFGLLKGRFRRLQNFGNLQIYFIVECVVAAAVLHNICIDFDDVVEYEIGQNEELEDEVDNNVSGIIPAYLRRQQMMAEMFPV